ncbi:MAG TPA: aminotransferase class V-fold PLP-dependent enzyme [Gemmatimonadaceae bacterium]
MTDPLLAYRGEFPILEHTTYLVSNSLGAMPRAVPERLAEYVDEWAEQGVRAWSRSWWQMPGLVGDEIAPLIGADAGQVVMVGNVTLGQATVLTAIDYPPQRNRIVMTELDFPSVRYLYDRLAARLGAEIVVVPAAADGISVDADAVVAAIDERTRLVCISQVLFRSAFVMDVAPIARRARVMGALLSLDAFHAVGVMPVDVKALGVDFLTGGVLKWLCGGPGGGFLYVAPGVQSTLEPALTGWLAHEQPFAFDAEMSYAQGPYRWLNGTPAIPALYAAIEGPRIVRRAGVDAIRAKSMRQTARLIELADARGYPVRTPRDAGRRGGTVAFDVPHAYEVSEYLLSRDVLVDFRPNAGIRVAPHFYTRDDELESVVALMDEALTTGRWREFERRGGIVT